MTQPRTTYPEVGATRAAELPDGYARLRLRHRLSERPYSVDDLGRLGEALLTWQVHAAARVRIETSAPVAEVGGRVTTRLGVGPAVLREPCLIVWVEREEQRIGFGYGTLPGHVFVGEESFVLERDAAGDVWFVVDVFSNPAVWWVAALRPLVPVFQRLYVAHLARAARRVLRSF
ncbi:DUF1990 family protein [Oerskovia turbata]